MRRKALKNAVRRVIRGGSYFDDTWGLRSTIRYLFVPEFRDKLVGFRLIARQK